MRFLKKTGCGFHNASLKPLALLLSALFLEVMQVGHTESAADRVDVKIDIPAPLLVKRTKHIRPDSASLGTTESLQFPDVSHKVFEIFRRRSYREAGRLDAFANLF